MQMRREGHNQQQIVMRHPRAQNGMSSERMDRIGLWRLRLPRTISEYLIRTRYAVCATYLRRLLILPHERRVGEARDGIDEGALKL